MTKRTLRRFLRNRSAVVGLLITAVVVVCAVFAPWIAPYSPTAIDPAHRLEGPSREHPFGLDRYGRDILSRVIYGSRVSLQVSLISAIIAGVSGTLLGIISGYLGGAFDFVVMRFIDVLLCFPSILLALAIVAVLGSSLFNVSLVIAIVSMPAFARLARGTTLSLREEAYVEASRACGAHALHIMRQHILPNCIAPIFVYGTLRLATMILSVAGLSFLGMGVQPPTPEWGAMVAEGRAFMLTAPHVALFPSLAITLTVMGFNLLGDGLRDALDPRLWV
ncbi:ABC transporter permease [Candidatus Bipolaricaulota bacterium]|nr:ABC transporter permease [Candidatus Bipolaricaulota bacterium]